MNSIYLLGGSMGGVGAWLMASEYPELFDAVMPVAGNPGNSDSGRVAKTQIMKRYEVSRFTLYSFIRQNSLSLT